MQEGGEGLSVKNCVRSRHVYDMDNSHDDWPPQTIRKADDNRARRFGLDNGATPHPLYIYIYTHPCYSAGNKRAPEVACSAPQRHFLVRETPLCVCV